MLRTHGRALAAFAAAVATIVASALTDGRVTTDEKLQIAVAFVTGIAVYLAPNYPNARWIKTAVAVVLAGLNAAAAALTGGISPAEWVNVIIAAIGVLAVGFTPSESAPEVGPARAALRADR
jgi:uncharacterized membrane protein